MTKTIKLPQPAEKPIEAVLEEFLGEERPRLKPKTLGKYQEGNTPTSEHFVLA